MWLPNPAALLSFAQDAVDKYEADKGKGGRKEHRAGLIFPPARFQTIIRQYTNKEKLGETSSVFLAALIEKVITDILSKERDKLTINEESVIRAVNLCQWRPLFKGCFILGSDKVL